MKTIWKFRLPLGERVTIEMPIGAQVLCAQMNGNIPSIWAVVDDQAPLEPHTFYIRGTGAPLGEAEDALYIGTFQIEGSISTLVVHVFEPAVEH